MSRVPHIDGDEPAAPIDGGRFDLEFPIFMGMNPALLKWFGEDVRVSHIHGDEPSTLVELQPETESSPYSWG